MTSSHASNSANSRGLAIAALVLGLAGLILAIVFLFTAVGPIPLTLGILLGVAAVILGIVALKKQQPKGMAVFGLVLGAVVAILGLAIWVFALLFVGALMANPM